MWNVAKALVSSAAAGLTAALLLAFAAPAAAGTLETVRQRGVLQCGVSEGLYGFPRGTARANGRASTWISAARWRARSSTIPQR